jgi:cytochrome c2
MAALGKRQQIFLWIAAALSATAVLLGLLIFEYSPLARRRVVYIAGNPEKGAELFFGSKHCSICHAVRGVGGRVGPDLTGRRPVMPAMGWLTTVLWNHAPGMWRQMRRGGGTYPKLNQEEMAHILAFLFETANLDPPGDVAAGRRVFEEKSCIRCHLVRGEGGTVGPELTGVAGTGDPAAWTRAMWNHAQRMIEPVTTALGRWPQFTGAEMNDLIAFASPGPPGAKPGRAARGDAERGWRVFQSKCMQCHAVRGQGGSVGPELGPDRDLPLSTSQFASVLWNHAISMLKRMRESGLALPALEGSEMTDLVAFLASLRYVEPSGSRFVGEKVFSERGCARCHGAKGEGTRWAPPLHPTEAFTSVSFATVLWRHGPRMQDRAEETGVGWPMLKPTDIGDLISFLNDSENQK